MKRSVIINKRQSVTVRWYKFSAWFTCKLNKATVYGLAIWAICICLEEKSPTTQHKKTGEITKVNSSDFNDGNIQHRRDVAVENKLRGCTAPGGWSCVIVAKQRICAVPYTRTCTAGTSLKNITLHYHGLGPCVCVRARASKWFSNTALL
jgi:hypothetical protein